MKKIISLVSALVILVLSSYTICGALDDNLLLQIDGYSITKSTTIDEILAVYGQPKLVTKSAFGGNAYSFHKNFDSYLYIETNENGVIACCATEDNSFSASSFCYGGIAPIVSRLSGYIYTNASKKVLAACVYNQTAVDMGMYWQNYNADKETYLRSMVQHGLMMFNAVSQIVNRKSDFEFSEKFFLINEQLKQSNQNFIGYTLLNNKQAFIQTITNSTDMVLDTVDASYLPNPLMFAKYAYTATILSGYTVPYFDCYKATTGYTVNAAFLKPELFDDRIAVDLSDSERELVQEAVRSYKQTIADYYAVMDNLYAVNPYTELPLQAGALSDGAKSAVTAYMNAIRKAAGLNPLALSDTLCIEAQHKSTLISYLMAHDMRYDLSPLPCPDGVPAEFYNMINRTPAKETAVTQDVLASILYSLSKTSIQADKLESIYCILNPSADSLGIGVSDTGSQRNTVYKTAGAAECPNVSSWPPKGVAMMNTIKDTRFVWSAKLYNGFRTTPNTMVEVKRLNDSETWNFDVHMDAADKKYAVYDNMVAFFADSFNPQHGDVFEVTLKNLQAASGQITDYSYRTIFQDADAASGIAVSRIDTNLSSVEICVNESAKIDAKAFPSNAANRMIFFKSSNPEIATVDEHGKVTAISAGQCTITSISQSSGVTSECAITVLPPKIDLVDSSIIINRDIGSIHAIGTGVSPAQLLARLKGRGGTLEIVNGEGNPLTSEFVGTGCKVRLKYGTEILEELDVIIYGDVNGNGTINSADVLLLSQSLIGSANLDGAYQKAADVMGEDERISAVDLMTLKSAILQAGPFARY